MVFFKNTISNGYFSKTPILRNLFPIKKTHTHTNLPYTRLKISIKFCLKNKKRVLWYTVFKSYEAINGRLRKMVENLKLLWESSKIFVTRKCSVDKYSKT